MLSSDSFILLDKDHTVEANSDTIRSVLETSPAYSVACCHAKVAAQVAGLISVGFGILGSLTLASLLLNSYEVAYWQYLMVWFAFNFTIGVIVIVGVKKEIWLLARIFSLCKAFELGSLIGTIISVVRQQLANGQNLFATDEWTTAIIVAAMVIYSVLLVVQMSSVRQYYKYLVTGHLVTVMHDKPKSRYIIYA